MSSYLILLIDDDPTQHLILGNYLRLSGYEVAHADEGKQGLKIMDIQKPDLLLLDIQMPGMDGFQVLETIRRNPAFNDLPILLLTSLDRQHLKIKGLELGADDYITKPYDQAELLARIKAALRRVVRSQRSDGMMEGNLSDLGLMDLLQSMELGNKTAIIKLKDINGAIYIDKGAFSHAVKGKFEGTDALLRIFLDEKGMFTVEFAELPENIPRAKKPLTGVLMSILAEVDEINDIISKIKAENKLIGIGKDATDFPKIEEVQANFPASVMDLIIVMGEHPKKNLKTVIQAFKKGALKVVN